MTKYVMCIDYKAATHKGLEYKVMNAKTVLEAIAEADARWDENIYMMQIMEKDGKTERENGWRIEKYNAVLARRSFGWHLNNEKNAEREHRVRHYIPNNADYHWFETL